MKMHKTLLTLVMLGALVATGWTYIRESARYTFTTQSTLRVEGTSTVHAWKAEASSLSGIAEFSRSPLEGGALLKASLSVPVVALETDNSTMNKKLREALKASAHPVITYTLDSATMKSAPADGAFQVLAKGTLSLAGVRKPVELTLIGTEHADGTLRFKGSYDLLMSDYAIKPPTAMLGTLKTGDKVTIHFDIVAAEESAL